MHSVDWRDGDEFTCTFNVPDMDISAGSYAVNNLMIIFVYMIADIPRNLTLLTSTTQGGTHNSRHTGQRYIQKV